MFTIMSFHVATVDVIIGFKIKCSVDFKKQNLNNICRTTVGPLVVTSEPFAEAKGAIQRASLGVELSVSA